MRSATGGPWPVPSKKKFQSTHSLRSATGPRQWPSPYPGRFNPRTPCGVRPDRMTPGSTPDTFQSTHSLRSATQDLLEHFISSIVSIHALLAECDMRQGTPQRHPGRFNPRTPCGVRPTLNPPDPFRKKVSIHALLAECDYFPAGLGDRHPGFNPRTPCGVRPGERRGRRRG